MSQIHLAHGACVAPVVEALKDAGAPVNRLLAQSGLQHFRLDDPNIFVPAECFHNFLETVARRETGPTLPHEIGSRYVLANMGEFGAEVFACADLRTACLLAIRPEARQLSYESVALDVRGRWSALTYSLAMPPGLARSWIERMAISLIVDACRTAAGADWFPAELHVADNNVDGLGEFISEETVVRCNAPGVEVRFPSELMARAMQREDPVTNGAGPGPRLGRTTAARIDAMLDSSTHEMVPNLRLIAELSDMSPRSMQRLLDDEGVSFFEVADRWRFRRSMRLISDPGVTVREIAESSRYSHSAHFVRAFKRWTGLTPQSFRESLPAQP